MDTPAISPEHGRSAVNLMTRRDSCMNWLRVHKKCIKVRFSYPDDGNHCFLHQHQMTNGKAFTAVKEKYRGDRSYFLSLHM